jgi:hypothetical protein
MGYCPFLKKPSFEKKITSKFGETDGGFGFSILDYLWSNFMKYRPFL